ncbi:hypothetical protein CRENBAI_025284 [Crenichthys baileyi]|uniref:Transposase n=1 Tax=Crenichthys baileyi TaxID=28760 RepID=A0AAV9QS39_9TELE
MFNGVMVRLSDQRTLWQLSSTVVAPSYSGAGSLPVVAEYCTKRKEVYVQQDNDPKHRSKLVLECLKQANIKVLERSSQRFHLSLIGDLWTSIKPSRCRKPTSFNQHYQKRWFNEHQITVEVYECI